MAKILVFAMTAREESFNLKLAKNSERLLKAKNHDVILHSLRDFELPLYDGDLEERSGVPEIVQQLATVIRGADALVIATPEYNGGIPGPFKNAMDWVSRVVPMPWSGKPILLTGTSPGALGAVRGLWHSRVPLEALGCFVYPEMLGLPSAAGAFDEQGQIKDAKTSERLAKLLEKFIAQSVK